MTKHQHSPAEIRAKLQQAEQMAAEGTLQRDIAQALNVSVMTYHRWRKSHPLESVRIDVGSDEQQRELRELQDENLRLRKLVTDLLLEKVKLEEEMPRGMRAVSGNGHAHL
jgi:transposase